MPHGAPHGSGCFSDRISTWWPWHNVVQNCSAARHIAGILPSPWALSQRRGDPPSACCCAPRTCPAVALQARAGRLRKNNQNRRRHQLCARLQLRRRAPDTRPNHGGGPVVTLWRVISSHGDDHLLRRWSRWDSPAPTSSSGSPSSSMYLTTCFPPLSRFQDSLLERNNGNECGCMQPVSTPMQTNSRAEFGKSWWSAWDEEMESLWRESLAPFVCIGRIRSQYGRWTTAKATCTTWTLSPRCDVDGDLVM